MKTLNDAVANVLLGEAKKYKKADVEKAIELALSMSGSMTKASKAIEKIAKGLTNEKDVADALRIANESVVTEETIDEAEKGGHTIIKKFLAQENKITLKINKAQDDIKKWLTERDKITTKRMDTAIMMSKNEETIDEASGGKEEYQKFFNSALEKFGVKSPAELDDAKKKEFFNYIDKNWEGKSEED